MHSVSNLKLFSHAYLRISIGSESASKLIFSLSRTITLILVFISFITEVHCTFKYLMAYFHFTPTCTTNRPPVLLTSGLHVQFLTLSFVGVALKSTI